MLYFLCVFFFPGVPLYISVKFCINGSSRASHIANDYILFLFLSALCLYERLHSFSVHSQWIKNHFGSLPGIESFKHSLLLHSAISPFLVNLFSHQVANSLHPIKITIFGPSFYLATFQMS